MMKGAVPLKEIKYKWVPVIDTDRCHGCNECVLACGPKCLAIVHDVAVLTKPDLCGSEEHCIAPCPSAAIQMAWVAMQGDESVGKWRG